jgi:hypothetical protein
MGKMKAAAKAYTAEPALIVFGLDDAKKAHASWFGPLDAELAERAAGFMRMRALQVVTAEQRELALQLPQGRIFESGKGFVPFAKMAAYERLSAFIEAFDPPFPIVEEAPTVEPVPTASSVPKTWEEISIGSLVLACEGEMQGWFESVVVALPGDDLVELRWRDWPEEPSIVRRVNDLGLVRAGAVTTPS